MSGFSDPCIEPTVYGRIMTELSSIEREHGVQILLAVESGSRAWRFPSPDSDYDVRFLYLHPVERYLGISPMRDVIERPIDAVLDISGWDLRKALQLMLRSNAVLLEWLTSPVRYRDGGDVATELLQLAQGAAGISALAYHYDHQARRSFKEITASDREARLKSYCYALRATLALLWLRRRNQPAPMDLPSLMAGLEVPDTVQEAIANLLARKSIALEGDKSPRIAILDGFIEAILAADPASLQKPSGRLDAAARTDAFFASVALGHSTVTR